MNLVNNFLYLLFLCGFQVLVACTIEFEPIQNEEPSLSQVMNFFLPGNALFDCQVAKNTIHSSHLVITIDEDENEIGSTFYHAKEVGTVLFVFNHQFDEYDQYFDEAYHYCKEVFPEKRIRIVLNKDKFRNIEPHDASFIFLDLFKYPQVYDKKGNTLLQGLLLQRYYSTAHDCLSQNNVIFINNRTRTPLSIMFDTFKYGYSISQWDKEYWDNFLDVFMLLSKIANRLNVKDKKKGNTIVHKLMKLLRNPFFTDLDVVRRLIFEALFGLLRQGFDPNIRNKKGKTALHVCKVVSTDTPYLSKSHAYTLACVRLLLLYTNQVDLLEDNKGEKALSPRDRELLEYYHDDRTLCELFLRHAVHFNIHWTGIKRGKYHDVREIEGKKAARYHSNLMQRYPSLRDLDE